MKLSPDLHVIALLIQFINKTSQNYSLCPFSGKSYSGGLRIDTRLYYATLLLLVDSAGCLPFSGQVFSSFSHYSTTEIKLLRPRDFSPRYLKYFCGRVFIIQLRQTCWLLAPTTYRHCQQTLQYSGNFLNKQGHYYAYQFEYRCD